MYLLIVFVDSSEVWQGCFANEESDAPASTHSCKFGSWADSANDLNLQAVGCLSGSLGPHSEVSRKLPESDNAETALWKTVVCSDTLPPRLVFRKRHRRRTNGMQ